MSLLHIPSFAGHLVNANQTTSVDASTQGASPTQPAVGVGKTLLIGGLAAALVAIVWAGGFSKVSEDHMLMAWSLVWAAAFAGLALLCAPLRRSTIVALNAGRALHVRQQTAAADRKLLAMARTDDRLMADLRAVADRGEVNEFWNKPAV